MSSAKASATAELHGAMPHAAPRARRGRPQDLAKRDAILVAACACFFDRGYDACTIEAVAHEAGVSKVTVYAHFGDKTALFRAAVGRECARLTALTTAVPDDRPFGERLAAFGHAMVAFLYRPEMLGFERHLAAAATRDPAVGAAFLEAGPMTVKRSLAGLIAEAVAAGEVAVPDPMLAAEQFGGMVKGLADPEWYLTGVIDRQRAACRVEAAVAVFLRAYAPATPPGSGDAA